MDPALPMPARVLVGLALCAAAALPSPAATPGEEAHRRGVEALQKGDYQTALRELGRAATLEPQEPDFLFDLGRACSAVQQWTCSIEAYERLLALEPEHSRALHNLGNVYFRRGSYEEAERLYDRALAADPEYLLAAFHHGRTLWQLGRSEPAEARFDRCLELPAGDERDRRIHLDCRFLKGTLRFRARDWEAAAALMEQVVAELPEHSEAHHYLGMSYRHLGRKEDALRELKLHREILAAARDDTPIEKRPEP